MLHYYVKRLTLLLLLVSFYPAIAQNRQEGNFMRLQHKAENYFDEGDYFNALKIYNELLKHDSLSHNYNYHTGVCKFYLKHFRHESLQHFQRSSPDISPEWYYFTGRALHLHGDFEDAIANYRKYKSLKGDKEFTDKEVEEDVSNSLTALQFMLKPVPAKVINMGSDINSEFSDYVPLISADGNKLFFTSRRPNTTGGTIDGYGQYFEDIYYSSFNGEHWSKPVQMPSTVNTNGHEACAGLMPEGEHLFIFRSNETMPEGALFSTKFDGLSWSVAEPLMEEINTAGSVEPSACMSPEGDIVYFTSNREGGYGGKDIYRVVKLPNGKWSKALNMGPNVNTEKDEDAPFIHPDGNHLYFSSTGHTGMGGFDIFVCEKNDAGDWSPPHNLGYPINTEDDDLYFVLTADRRVAYYSSSRPDGEGEADIYKILLEGDEMYQEVQQGIVLGDSVQPINAVLTLFDDKEKKMVGVYRSNGLTGKFILLMIPGHEYTLIAESIGYHTHSEIISLNNAEEMRINLIKKQ